MKLRSLIFIFICLFTHTISAHPKDENSLLRLTLTNQTPHTLYFTRIEKTNAGNQFDVPAIITPNQTAAITAEKTLHNDIFAQLLFLDETGSEARLFILDQEQVHMGQPVFNMSGDYYKSEVTSKTRNPNIGPRYLTYIAADLNVHPIPAILSPYENHPHSRGSHP